MVKNFKPEQLELGYGEEICHLIDELLNIELYRRDYKFNAPIFPQEEEFDNCLVDGEV